jgi:sugar/nucleoside kinase (ribokinase family)
MNKEIQLCGLGNGLVDIQYRIDEKTMSDFGMEKGEMRLIDNDERARLEKYFANYSFNRCSGGSAANSIIAFSQLGGKAAYKTVLGNDELGHFYADEFKELGIQLFAEFRNDYPTGLCFVFIAPDSERTMLTSLGATAFFSPKNLIEDVIAKSEWIYLEGYKFSQSDSTKSVFKSIEFAKKHNTKIAFGVSDVFITENFYEPVAKAVPDADLFFCNENEALSFTKENTIERAQDKLFSLVENVVITKGAKGSIVKWNNEVIDIQAFPTQAVDSTGAGDMFAGAFLYGIIEKNDPYYAGKLASYLSSKVVSQLGARMNDNYDKIKNEILSL